MKQNKTRSSGATADAPLKLNVRRTMIIGFAFFGITLLWQVYDSYGARMLTELFARALFNLEPGTIPTVQQQTDVQYIVGCVMALDNLAALIMLPIFGRLSDKTHTKLGKRMPYILVGTFMAAIAFPFMPILFHYNNLAGMIAIMAIVIFFMMMYRSPAVSLMPDITPKPLRSRANGIINIMGYIGGAVAVGLGMAFDLTEYLGYTYKNGGVVKKATWMTNNAWGIVAPFLIASVVMIISCVYLAFRIDENKLELSLRDEMLRGEQMAQIEDSVVNDEEKPMTKANKTMLWLILSAEFFWFMASNAAMTFQANYFTIELGKSFRSSMYVTVLNGVFAMIGFLTAGPISEKIGRKWTLLSGLIIASAGYGLFCFLPLIAPAGNTAINVTLAIVYAVIGYGFSLVHTNSFPMVVELCSSKKVGKFTSYYYASSMLAQTLTPVLVGLLFKYLPQGLKILPYYSLILMLVSVIIFVFVKNVKVEKGSTKRGFEALDVDD